MVTQYDEDPENFAKLTDLIQEVSDERLVCTDTVLRVHTQHRAVCQGCCDV